MKRTPLAALVLAQVFFAALCHAQSMAPPTLVTPEGSSVVWPTWLADHGPAAVLVWASWTPGSERALADARRLRSVAAQRGLDFVVVALQESLEDSRAALGGAGLPWLHDRHGSLLKALRLYDVPALAIVSREGEVLARLEATPQSLTLWDGP